MDAPIIDVREEALIRYLETTNKPYNVAQLLIGDFALSERACGEVKRVKVRPPYGKFEEYNDVWASLIDGRLYRQAKNRHDNYERNFAIVEVESGAEFFSLSFTNDHWQSILITLSLSFECPVILSGSMEETVSIIYEAWEKEKAGEHYVSPYIKRPAATTLGDYQRNLLMGLLNVGEQKALDLLDLFNTPFAVINWIYQAQVQYTKSGNPKQFKKDHPSFVQGFGPSFFLENQRLLMETYEPAPEEEENGK